MSDLPPWDDTPVEPPRAVRTPVTSECIADGTHLDVRWWIQRIDGVQIVTVADSTGLFDQVEADGDTSTVVHRVIAAAIARRDAATARTMAKRAA